MRTKKTAYELIRSQVETPPDIVRLVWKITHEYRTRVSRVLDLGAGDGRFAAYGRFGSYDGVEIDTSQTQAATLPRNARLHAGCAFEYPKSGYSLCIGNPPYVRHHDLDEGWRNRLAERLGEQLGFTVNRKCNLYVYFMMLGLLKTVPRGLLALLVPFEWTSRPATAPLRRYILKQRWHVDVYRFTEDIFDSVLTTASISIIDKRNRDGKWHYHSIDSDGFHRVSLHVTGFDRPVLPYEDRGAIWALRGMSPGTQKVFTLTEGERIHAGLTRDDVLPCVTTLRDLPRTVTKLTAEVFRKRFLDSGAKCWLIRSHEELSPSLKAYLDSAPESLRDTWTCSNREEWYKFDLHPCPSLLVATGFTSYGPKVLVNTYGAYAVGAVCGIHAKDRYIPRERLRAFLSNINFEKRVVAHSGSLKKIEMRQLNAVLRRFCSRYLPWLTTKSL
jgi:hypothetical protein